jgi:ubiquinone/menaquinone biosynthesis C-methylase UbiE
MARDCPSRPPPPMTTTTNRLDARDLGPTMETDNTRAVSFIFRWWSGFYDNPIAQRLLYRRVHHRIIDRWRPARGERVLDVGCGTGLFLKGLAAEYDGLELTGLDLSEEMLSQARRGATNARSKAPEFIQGSVYEMPFADGAFDIATNSISCHFYLEQVRAFREIHRVLAPGGRFFCAALDARRLGIGGLRGVAIYDPVPVLEEHFREAGFRLIAMRRIFPAIVLFELRKPGA